MAKKDKKVIKVKTATVGKSFGTKKVDSDIEFLKAKLLKGKKGETISDIGADILKRNKAKEPVEDDGLSDMARMILANKNKKEIIEDDEEVIEEESEIVIAEEVEVEVEEEEIEEEIEEEVVEDIIEEEPETETEEPDEHLLGWVSCMRGKIVRHYGPEVEACVKSITHSNSNWTAILKCIVSVKGISNPEIWIPEQLVLFALWAGECFFSEEESEEVEELEEAEEVVLVEPEAEAEPEDEINVDIIEPDVLDDIELELDIIDEEIESELEEDSIIDIVEVVDEEFIEDDIIIDGDVVDVSQYQKNEINEESKIEIYNYKDEYSYVRIFNKLDNKTSFRLHIPRSTPRQQFYIDSTSSEFVIKHKNNSLFDFHSYSGHIDFTIQGMLFQGKLYPFQELEFVKM